MKLHLCEIAAASLVMCGCATQDSASSLKTASRVCSMSLSVTGTPAGDYAMLRTAMIASSSAGSSVPGPADARDLAVFPPAAPRCIN